jgi:hypothetical protein
MTYRGCQFTLSWPATVELGLYVCRIQLQSLRKKSGRQRGEGKLDKKSG